MHVSGIPTDVFGAAQIISAAAGDGNLAQEIVRKRVINWARDGREAARPLTRPPLALGPLLLLSGPTLAPDAARRRPPAKEKRRKVGKFVLSQTSALGPQKALVSCDTLLMR